MPDIFNVVQTEFDTSSYLLVTLVAFLCGIIAAFAAGFKASVTKSFVTALVLMPPIVETVIIMVNGNLGTGVAVMGAFSLVRFRSAPGKAKDIVAIFLAMTAGLACAAGYWAVALVFTVAVCLAMVLISLVSLKADRALVLKITVPETLNYDGVFDDEFSTYLKWHKLQAVKTTNMGSLFRLTYKVEMKKNENTKEFMDKLRIKNGNLEISLSEYDGKGEEL